MRILSFLLLLSLPGLPLVAQQKATLWTPVATTPVPVPEAIPRPAQPAKYLLFSLNNTELNSLLAQAPVEFTTAAKNRPVLLDLPMPDGSLRTFKICYSPVVAPELAAKYPAIRTYSGTATDGSGAVARIGTGYQGFYSFIFETNGSVQSIRPWSDQENAPFMVYAMNDLPAPAAGTSPRIRCGTEDLPNEMSPDEIYEKLHAHSAQDRGNVPVKLRKYRIAIAAKGEYTTYHGGTKEKSLSAIVTSLNFIASIFERDFAIKLELIANNDAIIYTDSNTDPYSGTLASDWMNQNTDALNTTIGSSSYDIGHIYGFYITGTAVGVARRGQVCDLFDKSKGSSSENPPVGERFYLVAAHEMCHQFNGAHTWNNCTDDILTQRMGDTAYEPGSGTTIMSYAGSCLSNDVFARNESYFHTASIDQVRIYTTLGPGSICGTEMILPNNLPTVTIDQPDGFFIPKSTPFTLSAQATDPDGDANLTYCWEQYDLGDTIDLGKQKAGNQPLFRSFEPVQVGKRSFPRITNVFSNINNKSELLPDRSRNLTFRCTVRDNRADGGGVANDVIRFKVSGDAGPFMVDAPATNALWQVGSYQDVVWKVNNTDKAPVNCKTVNIWLSTSGVNGFNIKLASDLPNNGKACILVPNRASTIARILVEAADNIFYDINPGSFRIQQPTQPGFDVCIALAADFACLPRKYEVAVASGSLLGFTNPVTMSVTGLPVGTAATFSKNPIAPGETTQMTIDFPVGTPEGVYNIKVTGTSGAATAETTTQLTVVSNNFSGMTLVAPANGVTDGGVTALKWNTVPDALSYGVEIAESPSFDPPLAAATNLITGTWTLPVSLSSNKIYYWRVRGINECSPNAWTEPFFFVTPIQNCTTLVSTDIPKTISANSLNTVESKIEFGQNGTLTDVNVLILKGNHVFFKDLDARLIAPGGQQTILFANKCGSYNGSFNFGFDGNSIIDLPCPPNQASVYKPGGNLALLNGTDAKGSWILRVRDNVVGSGGQIAEFVLQLCFAALIQPPVIVKNSVLTVTGATNAVIGSSLLKAEDPNNNADQLTFTLITAPTRGTLLLSGNPLAMGGTFTQTDVDNGLLRYQHTSATAGTDRFRFIVTDGEGGFVSDTFDISPVVRAFEPAANTLHFDLSPNPATDQLRVEFAAPLDAITRLTLLDAAGRTVRSWQIGEGNNQTLLQLSGIPVGFYLLSVENGQGRGVKKVSKVD